MNGIWQHKCKEIEGSYQINDDVAGLWVQVLEDENEFFKRFLCEDAQIMLHYLLRYNPNNPINYND